MSSPIRTAVIGCGGAGTNHAGGYARADGAELVAVCDLDADRAATLADAHDVPWTDDVESLLADYDPDLVSVTTPERHHVEPARTALAAGVDVLCEKIMADSVAGARELEAVAADHGRTLAVNYNYRHMPSFATIKEAVDTDRLGTVRLVSADVHAYGWHHGLDLLRFLLGEPTSVRASIVDDDALRDDRFAFDGPLYIPTHAVAASLMFDDGVLATIASSIHSPLDEHLIDLAVTGEAGRARITGMTPADSTGTVGSGPLQAALQTCESITLEESFYRSVAAVVEAVRTGTSPPTTGTDGRRLVELEAAVRRAAAGEEVKL